MSTLSWKSLSLLVATLLVAVGLQAGAIKIMTRQSQPDEQPAKAAAHSAPEKPHASIAQANDAHEASTPVPPAQSTALVADPPHLAGLNTPHGQHAQADSQAQTSPEAPPSPAHLVTAPLAMPLSTIPPPIELDKPPAEEPAEAAHSASPPGAAAETVLSSEQPAEPAASANTLLEPRWLEARDPNHYTVQLYSGKEMDKLREIAQSITGDRPQAYFITPSRSGPWYSLVVGDYPNFTAAQTSATEIAAQASTIKPWIRRFSEIQARMRR